MMTSSLRNDKKRSPRTPPSGIQQTQEPSTENDNLNAILESPQASWVPPSNTGSQPEQKKAIMELRPPRNLQVLRGLKGRLTYILRCILYVTRRRKPFPD